MKKSALINIDFINDIVHPEGKLKSCVEQCARNGTMLKVNEASAIARAHNMLVIHVKVGFDGNYQSHPEHSPFFGKAKEYKALMLDSWGTAFHQDIEIQPEDSVVVKSRISAFYATNLETFLRAQGVEQVFITGVSSTWGVQSTVRDAHDRDYRVFILKDGCADRTENAHELAMDTLAAVAGIIPVAEMKSYLGNVLT